jgi:glucose-1-phosphate adenylyltransferase
VRNAIITEGNTIYGTVENSVLFSGVTVEAGAVVRDAVIMQGCTIKSGATVQYAILDSEVVVGEGATVGQKCDGEQLIAVVGSGVRVVPHDTIAAGDMVNAAEYEKKNKGGENA